MGSLGVSNQLPKHSIPGSKSDITVSFYPFGKAIFEQKKRHCFVPIVLFAVTRFSDESDSHEVKLDHALFMVYLSPKTLVPTKMNI